MFRLVRRTKRRLALVSHWDPAARRWYALPGRGSALARWAPLPEVPEVLPGEDRGFGVGLFVDLVPSSCWFTNGDKAPGDAKGDRTPAEQDRPHDEALPLRGG